MIGGTTDHVHALFLLSKNHTLSRIVEQVKKGSSKWIKTQGSEFANFHWQNGYGSFSVSQSHVAQARRYIESQEEHHRSVTFQEEFRLFLKRYHVEYDERYVWDLLLLRPFRAIKLGGYVVPGRCPGSLTANIVKNFRICLSGLGGKLLDSCVLGHEYGCA